MGTNEKNAKLWENIQAYAKKVGRVAAKPALQLYYVMTAEGTSRGTKILIGSALAYTILPINLISKEDHPILGRADEAAALLIVYNKVKKNITPEIEQKTEETLDKWFAEEGTNESATESATPNEQATPEVRPPYCGFKMKHVPVFLAALIMIVEISCDRHQGEDQTGANQVKVLEVEADSLVRGYHYGAAAGVLQIIVNQYANVIDSAAYADYQNSIRLYGALASVEPQRIHKQCDVTIPSYQNEFSHLIIPVECGGKTDGFVFDTGANLSTITQSEAAEMGLTMIDVGIEVGSSTDIDVTSQLAVADSIEVGGILFENVVFLVLSDEMLSFPSIGYEIHGIIGFPVISQMEEIRMNRDGTIFTPFESVDKGFQNMHFDEQNIIVQVIHESDTLQFFLDTGSNTSQLSKKYFDVHEEDVLANAELQHVHRGGAGGVVEVDEYVLEDFTYTIGSQSNILEQMPVSLEEKHNLYDGVMGQDIFGQFNTMILNFKYRYLDLE